jgi:hypothetical protein
MEYDPIISSLLAEIQAFRDKVGLSPTQFGRLATNDGNFIRAIRMGRTPSLGTIAKVRRFMKTYKRRAA